MNAKTERYTESVGRRKTSTARARITPAAKQEVVINGQPVQEYFRTDSQRARALAPLAIEGAATYRVSVVVRGGGLSSQSEAVRHGIARALASTSHELRKPLKDAGTLTRDQRMKERRKFGLKKARRAPQWSKR